MISDNLGGPSLAERIPATNGWQEFTIYRGVEKSGEVTVTAAMTGVGTAMVDEITIRTMDLPNRQAQLGKPGQDNRK